MALKYKIGDMFLKIFQLVIKVLGFSSFFLLFFLLPVFFFSLRDLPDFLHSYLLFPFKKIFKWFHGILYELYLQICISALSFIVLNVAFIRFPSILS